MTPPNTLTFQELPRLQQRALDCLKIAEKTLCRYVVSPTGSVVGYYEPRSRCAQLVFSWMPVAPLIVEPDVCAFVFISGSIFRTTVENAQRMLDEHAPNPKTMIQARTFQVLAEVTSNELLPGARKIMKESGDDESLVEPRPVEFIITTDVMLGTLAAVELLKVLYPKCDYNEVVVNVV